MNISNKKILITGGEGFIGSHLVQKLNATPLDNRSFNKVTFKNTIVKDISSDLTDTFKDFDLIIHSACRDIRHSINEPIKDAETNIIGTLNILKTCRKLNIPLFYISSVSVESEASHYAISKYAGEKYCFLYKQWIPICIVRLSNVFGGNDAESVIAKWIHEPEIKLIDAEHTRDFTYYKDSIDAIVKAIEIWPDKIINIGTGKEIKLGGVAKWLSHRLNKKILHINNREIDNVKTRKTDRRQLQKGLGYQIKWDFYEALEEYLSIIKNG